MEVKPGYQLQSRYALSDSKPKPELEEEAAARQRQTLRRPDMVRRGKGVGEEVAGRAGEDRRSGWRSGEREGSERERDEGQTKSKERGGRERTERRREEDDGQEESREGRERGKEKGRGGGGMGGEGGGGTGVARGEGRERERKEEGRREILCRLREQSEGREREREGWLVLEMAAAQGAGGGKGISAPIGRGEAMPELPTLQAADSRSLGKGDGIVRKRDSRCWYVRTGHLAMETPLGEKGAPDEVPRAVRG
ncbi:hypothetical protein ACLOJK_039093 [Asimina triloba]